MTNYTRDEQITCCIARSFTEEDDFCVIATSFSGSVALVLAKELYAPGLSLVGLAEGRYAILKDIRFPMTPGSPPEECIETVFSTEEAFSLVAGGKWFVIMQAVQIDQYAYMNLSLLGDKFRPTQSFVGSRGIPTNTVIMPRTLLFVSNHVSRVFVEEVDFKSGVGYGEERKEGIVKWGAPIEVISNLCLIDFEEKSGKARLKSLHTGVSLGQVKKNTGFDLIIPEDLSETPAPSDEELRLLREVIDPCGVRRLDFVRGEEYKQVMNEIMATAK